jgi:NAD+ synthase (glutamine-hydrolysing)
MRIALAQINGTVGHFEQQKAKILAGIEQAKQSGAQLIVFPELTIGGYPAKDLWRSQAFIAQAQQCLQEVVEASEGIACIIGAPVPNLSPVGKALFNAAVVCENRQITQVIHKSLLPDYDIFDEGRYFEPARHFGCINIQGYTIALTICEDLWDNTPQFKYFQPPMEFLLAEKPQLLINIAASPYSQGHEERRKKVLKAHVALSNAPLVYVNQIGAQTDLIFDGRSLVMDKDGEIQSELKAFEEDFQIIDIEEKTIKFASKPAPIASDPIADIHRALLLGIQDYFQKSGFKSAVLGLSGGLDSALVAALACEALGPENVHAVLMPSAYSSDHSVQDALDLVENTGCHAYTVPIAEVAEAFEEALAPSFAGKAADTTEENIQARIRGIYLMAFSNKFGHILLNTSNKSEAAVGYGTLYGDMAGALSVIGDLYKTQAYQLAQYINRDRVIIPINTLIKPPSAELRPDQKDSDSLPEYPVLDAILYGYIEEEKNAAQLIQEGHDIALVERILRLVHNAEFKRFQAPPILRISRKAFGSGRVMPLVAKYPLLPNK